MIQFHLFEEMYPYFVRGGVPKTIEMSCLDVFVNSFLRISATNLCHSQTSFGLNILIFKLSIDDTSTVVKAIGLRTNTCIKINFSIPKPSKMTRQITSFKLIVCGKQNILHHVLEHFCSHHGGLLNTAAAAPDFTAVSTCIFHLLDRTKPSCNKNYRRI